MKLIIEVVGGCISNIIATEEVSIHIVDHDNIKEKGDSTNGARESYQPDLICKVYAECDAEDKQKEERGSEMVIKYFAWLSTKGEQQYLKDGAIYVGLVRDAPHFLKHLLNKKENRQYCVISAA